jgi:hypothetical protein
MGWYKVVLDEDVNVTTVQVKLPEGMTAYKVGVRELLVECVKQPATTKTGLISTLTTKQATTLKGSL